MTTQAETMSEIIIFDLDFLAEFQEKFGCIKGVVRCLVYQMYLDNMGWDAIAKVISTHSLWRIKHDLVMAGYIAPERCFSNRSDRNTLRNYRELLSSTN